MDNRYFEYKCPPLMSDGRFLSNHINASVVNQKIRSLNRIKSSDEFRFFLQNNAVKIIDNELKYLNNNNRCKIIKNK